jgi:hypothetical protein
VPVLELAWSQPETWPAGEPGSSSPAGARRNVGTGASAGIGLEAATETWMLGARVAYPEGVLSIDRKLQNMVCRKLED